MRIIKMLFTVTLGVCLCVYIGYLTEMQCASGQNTVASSQKTELLSIEDFQRMLNKIEPSNPIPADGKLGPATQKKWDRIICNRYAVTAMKLQQGTK